MDDKSDPAGSPPGKNEPPVKELRPLGKIFIGVAYDK
jgi:hypothetical protein